MQGQSQPSTSVLALVLPLTVLQVWFGQPGNNNLCLTIVPNLCAAAALPTLYCTDDNEDASEDTDGDEDGANSLNPVC